jgi:class 3 adenylate cyclase/tetratricopeptide (TPR) repeat protein
VVQMESSPSVDELLDRSVAAMNRGDVAVARDLAGAALAVDAANPDATTLLAAEPGGELRRASLLFADLVGSTALSARLDPELYRTLLRRYKALCREAIEARYGGHISHITGDGLLAVFGLPVPHENDTERAVRAALEIVSDLRNLSAEIEPIVGEPLVARAAVHKGLVYLDTEEDEVYGLAANVAARLQGLAAPGTVVVSDEVQSIVGVLFDTVEEPARQVKGVDRPLRPHRVVASRPEVPGRGRPRPGRLVDREAEWAVLLARWGEARRAMSEGHPPGVHLVADAGMGKSRLAAALADEVRDEATTCVELLGSPFHPDASFHAVRTLLQVRCGIGRSTAAADRLARLDRELGASGLSTRALTPLLAPILDIRPDVGYEPAPAQGRKLHEHIIEAAARYLLSVIGAGPALLLVEDVHWCDESTLDVVGHVLRSRRSDILVVTTSRELPPPSLARLQAVALEPLDSAASAELVRTVDPGIDAERCLDLVERSDGVPLFLEELARAPASPSVDTATLGAGIGPVPDALYEPLVARLYATPSGVSVAAAAAAIGRDVDRRLLAAAVVDVSEQELDQAISALLGGLILERTADDEQRYHFRHELLRAVAYDLQPPSVRRELHGRVADALAGADPDADAVDWRVVARHYDAAGRAAEAIAAYDRAAEGARRMGALTEARSLLARAVEMVSDLPDGPERRSREVGLRLRRGFLAASAEGNNSPDAVRDYERCLELSLVDTDSDQMFRTLYALWAHYMLRGDLGRVRQVTDMLRSSLAGRREHYAPDIDAMAGAARWFAGDFVPALAQLESARDALRARGGATDDAVLWFAPTEAEASVHALLTLARFVTGDAEGALAQAEAARRFSEGLEFPRGPYSAANAVSYAIWMALERDDVAGASAGVDALTDIAERHGFEFWSLVAATQQAQVAAVEAVHATLGDAAVLAAHAGRLEGLCAVWRSLDLGLFCPSHLALAGRLHLAAGDHGKAGAQIDEALRFSDETGMRYYDAELLRLRAQVAAQAGAVEEVVPRLRAALDVARAQGAVPFERRIARDLRAALRLHG